MHVAFLLAVFALSSAAQQIATCQAGFDWSFNKAGQSPCELASTLIQPCVSAPFPIPPLVQNFTYGGPQQGKDLPCTCNTVVYSLLSACAICQGHDTLLWSIYDFNCTTVYAEVYPLPIPSGVSVPHYAYLDVTASRFQGLYVQFPSTDDINGKIIQTSNMFNATLAQAAGGPESTSSPTPTSTSGTATSTSSTNKTKSSHVGAIAGGAVGGVAGLALLALLIMYLIVRRKRKANRLEGPFYDPPLQDERKTAMEHVESGPQLYPGARESMRFYNPNDPSTFPPPNSAQYPRYPQV